MPEHWTPGRVVKRAAEVLRTEGVRSLWFKVLGETIYRRLVLLERPLDGLPPAVTAHLPVDISLLTRDEVGEYSALRPRTNRAEIERRLAAGQRCFIARHEGHMVHAAWAATDKAWIDYLRCDLRLAADEVYIYDVFTDPGYRGQNISPARIAEAFRFFQEAGYRRLVAAIMPENKAAFRPCDKTGYRPLATIGYVKIGPWRRDFYRENKTRGEHDTTYWDGVSQELGQRPHYLDPFLGRLKRQAYLDLIRRWGGTPATGRVLKTDLFEEAMGPDAFLADLAPGNGLAVGIDLSAAIAGQARAMAGGDQTGYVAADVRHLPFAGGSFALIVSPSTLDHFADGADLGRSLQELGRVLEPGGRLIVTLDNRQNLFDPLLRLAARLRRVPYYLGRSYRVAELRAELEAAGLPVQDTTAILHNPRLVAVGAVYVANRLGWAPLQSLVRRTLTAAQRLENTRWRYRSGSFIAALGVRRRKPQAGDRP